MRLRRLERERARTFFGDIVRTLPFCPILKRQAQASVLGYDLVDRFSKCALSAFLQGQPQDSRPSSLHFSPCRITRPL
jgi:hypothetical protein